MNLNRKRTWRQSPALFYVLVTILLLIVLFLPIEIPYAIKTMGKILPAKEWLLIQSAEGGFTSVLLNHKTGVPQAYTVAQIERGDAASLRFRPILQTAEYVSAGDTLGAIHSYRIREQLAALKASLANAEARLKVVLSGEKPSLVEAAERRLTFAESALAEQEKVASRLKALHERDLVSKEEFEISESQKQLREIDVAIEKAELQSANTGSSPVEIALARKEIDGLKKRIAVLEAKSSQYVLTSPLSGKITPASGGDTLFCVTDTSAFIAVLPIHVHERAYIETGLQVAVREGWRNKNVTRGGEIIRVLDQVRVLNGEQVFIAMVQLNPGAARPMIGAFERFSIEAKPVTIIEYLKRMLISIPEL